MIDFKRTLLNLHETFPEFDLDTLIKIIECITTETPYINLPQQRDILPQQRDIMYYDNGVTCKTSTWNSILDKNANIQLKKEYSGPRVSSVGRGTLSDEE